jgi:hypothetical protein
MQCRKCSSEVTELDVQMINGRPFCMKCCNTVTEEDMTSGKSLYELYMERNI